MHTVRTLWRKLMKRMRIAAGIMVVAMAFSTAGCDKLMHPRATSMTTEETVVTSESTTAKATKATKATSETAATSQENKTPSAALIGRWIGAGYNSCPGGTLEFKKDGTIHFRNVNKKGGGGVDPALEIKTKFKATDKDVRTCNVTLAKSGETTYKQLECKIDGHKLRVRGLPMAGDSYYDFYNASFGSAKKSRDTQLYGEWVYSGVNDKKINNTEDERIEFFQDNTAKITSYLPNDKRKENRGRLDLYYNVEYNWDGSYMLLLWEKESGNLYKVYYSYLLTTTKIKFFTLLDPATRKMTSKEYKRPMPALEDTTTPTEK